MNKLLQEIRSRGLWLNAEDALVIERALQRAHISVTEPGADVIKRFMQRCEELKKP